jgi:lipopolysaccharide/colanic/teichoic acid biosynthesis glycosyltransferase
MLPVSEKTGIAEPGRYAPQKTGAFHRAFDALCAGLGLLLLSPLLCLITAAIKLDDGGPVFYRQDRVGRSFCHFRICKFRSMVPGSDRGSLLTAFEDPRLTHLGRWLRRYKLDELPQLFNVLRGEMQLVGARPEVQRYVEMFLPQYALILQDRPGITDPASLAYRREDQILSAASVEQQYVQTILPAKLQLSLAYQARRTFLSDVGILLRTVAALIDLNRIHSRSDLTSVE